MELARTIARRRSMAGRTRARGDYRKLASTPPFAAVGSQPKAAQMPFDKAIGTLEVGAPRVTR